ncbi:heme/hemin ABC transporter substrate-binding protein [Actinoalloteichus hymeniacidonis]|uniref:ABC-type hemin transport system, periplasmic component n=1 Tax=Actinoalloteichus hymeniacidonis TaxID=340345 RepID=A0AAC9HV84_9PSEU|nr:ABC transporter substrate-binding protein [Actinoalloteichus hymeniacidonis]AOS66078.1 ABC-type hemin transport system, periplasmic component [Actinoalloteichus hymeniacidonis]MBB5905818.1 iron complex transport system substrate-binding protein [Actinoalloteichus hymeniacidonis]
MRLADHAAGLAVAVLGACFLSACSIPGDEATESSPFACVPAQSAAESVAVDPIDSAPTPQLPVDVTSADGTEVQVTDVSRILAVNLNGSLAEIVFSLGLGDNVVGRDIATTFEQAEDLPVVTQAHDLSAEGVLDLDPSVVLVDSSIGPPEVITQLRESGVPVVSFEEAWSIEEIAPRIEVVAEALGVPEAGEQLIERTEAELASALDQVGAAGPSPRIAFLYLRGSAGVYLLAGEGSGADSMIEAIGGIDAGSDIGIEKFRPITSEALINAAPDVILMMSGGLESVGGVDGLVEVPGVAQTPAGRNRCVVDVDDGTLLSFGPRTGQIVVDLAARIERAG